MNNPSSHYVISLLHWSNHFMYILYLTSLCNISVILRSHSTLSVKDLLKLIFKLNKHLHCSQVFYECNICVDMEDLKMNNDCHCWLTKIGVWKFIFENERN